MAANDSSWFSVKRFAVALGAVALGAVGGMILIPYVGTYLGMGLGGFVAGLAFADRPLLEAGLAAVLAKVGTVTWSLLGGGIIDAIMSLISLSPGILLLSVVLSFGVGTLGAHFGNDLRDGLTRPIDESGRQRGRP